VRRRQGRPQEALALLAEAGPLGAALVCRARIAIDGGDLLRATELLERRLRQIPPDRRLERVPVLAPLVRSRVARGELEEATTVLAELRDVARLAGTAPLRAHADLGEGMLAAAQGDHERARSLLEDAVDGFQREGAPFEAAQARIELATTLLALGRADGAEQEAVAALEQLRSLGAEHEAGRAESIRTSASRPSGGDGVAAQITRRERDVLRLLADGLTNRQIADRLVVSEHTVHRHVTNILRKLRLPSRTAAAAYAVRTGLLD